MPKTKPLGPDPADRPNWDNLNEGQRRYSYEQWNLAKVRRGIPIDHPIPSISDSQDSVEIPETPSSQNRRAGEGNMSDDTPMSGEVTPAKRTNNENVPATPAKRRGIDAVRRQLPGTAGSQGDPSMGPPGGEVSAVADPTVDKPFLNSNQIIVIEVVHKPLTSGIAYHTTPDQYNGNKVTITPAAAFPWDKVACYMGHQQFLSLPLGSKVEEVTCTVKAKNVRQAFQTSSTGTTLATLNQNKEVFYGIGLLDKLPAQNFHPSAFLATEPMIATSLEAATWDNWSEYRFGFDGGSINYQTEIADAQFGYQFPLRNYLGVLSKHHTPVGTTPGWAPFSKYVHACDATATVNMEIVKATYRPVNGWMKPVPFNTGLTGGNNYVAYNGFMATTNENFAMTTGVNELNPITKSTKTSLKPADLTVFSNYLPVERSHNFRTGIRGQQISKHQPSLHIGCFPAPALSTSGIILEQTPKNYIDTQAEFEVKCTMVISVHYEHEFPGIPTINTHNPGLFITEPTVVNSLGSDDVHICNMMTEKQDVRRLVDDMGAPLEAPKIVRTKRQLF